MAQLSQGSLLGSRLHVVTGLLYAPHSHAFSSGVLSPALEELLWLLRPKLCGHPGFPEPSWAQQVSASWAPGPFGEGIGLKLLSPELGCCGWPFPLKFGSYKKRAEWPSSLLGGRV